MGLSFLAGLAWLFVAGAACLLSAGRLKRNAMRLFARAFGVSVAPALYAMLTLPGFFLHEGAHALTALILRVPIRGVTFIPRRADSNLGVGAGVRVARRDVLRMALIALAPLVAGIVALGLLTGALATAGSDPRPWVRLPDWITAANWRAGNTWITIYLLWSISSHMAPSATDMRYVGSGAVAILAGLVVMGVLLMLIGKALLDSIGILLGRLGDGLAVGAGLNVLMLILVALLSSLVWRFR
jgi:hypothetical protein